MKVFFNIENTLLLSSPTETATTIKDEQNKTVSNTKVRKRRKKKSCPVEKLNRDNILTSSSNFSSTSTLNVPSNIEPDTQSAKRNKQESDSTAFHNFEPTDTLTTHTLTLSPAVSEMRNIQSKQSSQIKTSDQRLDDSIPKIDSLSQINSCLSSTTSPESLHIVNEKMSNEGITNKLDLFLPEYIREQLNSNQVVSSSITDSANHSNVITTVPSSYSIRKKKQRSKMLKKDHECIYI